MMDWHQRLMFRYLQLLRFIMVTMLMLLGSIVIAQSDDPQDAGAEALRSLGNNQWYDAESDSAAPFSVEPETQDSDLRHSRWNPKAKKVRKKQAPAAGAAPVTGWSLGGINVLGWIVIVVLIGCVILAAALLIQRLESQSDDLGLPQSQMDPKDAERVLQERMAELPDEIRMHKGDLRSQAEYLMQQGRYDEAIILLYGHQLLLLDRQAWIRLSRGKTNGRYHREASRSVRDAGQLLGETIRAFEASYFGRYPVTESQFRKIWEDNQQLETLVRGDQ